MSLYVCVRVCVVPPACVGQAVSLQVDESSLTGETEPSLKDVTYQCPHPNVPLAERKVGSASAPHYPWPLLHTWELWWLCWRPVPFTCMSASAALRAAWHAVVSGC